MRFSSVPKNVFYGLLPLVKVIEADRMWSTSQDWYLDLMAFRESASTATCTLNTCLSDVATTEERERQREKVEVMIAPISFSLLTLMWDTSLISTKDIPWIASLNWVKGEKVFWAHSTAKHKHFENRGTFLKSKQEGN